MIKTNKKKDLRIKQFTLDIQLFSNCNPECSPSCNPECSPGCYPDCDPNCSPCYPSDHFNPNLFY